MSIEGVALEHYSALPQTEINSFAKACPLHAVFRSFLSDDSKHYSATTNTLSKRSIGLIEKQKVLTSPLGTIWGNNDGCV